MTNMHIALRGPRTGEWVPCGAEKRCRNSRLHVTPEQLHAIKAWKTDRSSVTESDVLRYTKELNTGDPIALIDAGRAHEEREHRLQELRKRFLPVQKIRESATRQVTADQTSAWVGSLTEEEKDALTDFSRWDSNETNLYFYKDDFREAFDNYDPIAYPGVYSSKPEQEQMELMTAYRQKLLDRVAHMDAALSKETPFSEGVVLYRGDDVPYTENESKYMLEVIKTAYPIGSTYSRSSFMSTSSNPVVAGEFARSFVFEILADRGGPIQDLAHVQREEEIILPRDEEYEIIAIHPNVKYRDTQYNWRVETMVEKDIKEYTVVQMVSKRLLS
jgi:hypothetical protein